MTDLLTALAERLDKVPRYCDYCSATEDAPGVPCRPWGDSREHSWLADGHALAAVALAFVAERLPTAKDAELLIRHAIGRWSRDGNEDLEDLVAILTTNLLRDWRERLGVKR